MKREILVLDASAILAWLHSDEENDSIDQAMLALKHDVAIAYAPQLLRYEVINNIGTSLRQRRITAAQAQQMAAGFQALPIKLDEAVSRVENYDLQLLDFMAMHSLTAYDAAYLELAQRLPGRLITLDQKLLKAQNQ